MDCIRKRTHQRTQEKLKAQSLWVKHSGKHVLVKLPRTTVSQDVQTPFSVQLAFAKFLSKIKGNF